MQEIWRKSDRKCLCVYVRIDLGDENLTLICPD